jgi:peptide deformylase
MTLRRIVTLPEPVLRRKAHAVTRFDKNLQSLIDDMVETMREAPGVGLAAPQIGLSERLIVVEYYEREEDEEKEDAPKKVWAVLNPEIIKASEEKLLGVEGCLSIPGLVGEKIKAEGWLARIFQHESDHLNGVLFTDRATRVWKPQDEVEPEQEV